ncbi:MAG: calcium-translocating P-type ATPase, PMCA-type [Christensenellales bacterium]
MRFFSIDAKKTLQQVASRETGLTENEVSSRIEQNGANKLDEHKKQSLAKKFFAQFKDLMVIILIVSAVISISMSLISKNYGDLFEGGIIVFIVILNAVMGVVQENKAENALESLKKRTEPFCDVIRDNTLQKIPVENLVVGDIVVLSAGNIIPADLRLIETHNLKVDESSLTGESVAVEKNADVVLDEHTNLAEHRNMAYSGTIAIYGRAKGVVVEVGKNTEIGKIATMLATGKKEQTPLQKSLNKIGKIISISVLIIAGIIFAIELIVPKSPNFMEAFLTAVALAVAAIPESMPAAITIIMALSVQKLAEKNAIIKRLHAVETLGSCQVICTDKTGTLTQNKMTVQEIYYNNNTVVKASQQDSMQKHFKEIINTMILCNDSEISNGKIVGEPTETALFVFAQNSGFDVAKIKLCSKRIYEIPFDSDRKLMSSVNIVDNQTKMYTKGAYDFLIGKCTKMLIGGKVEQLTKSNLAQIEQANKNMTQKALRVLCLAYKPIENSNGKYEEKDLIFLGLVGLIDPPRKEAQSAIKDCFKAGLKPVMITGDHADTAFEIAKSIGIARKKSQVMTGDALNKLSDLELSHEISKYSVFARVTPQHKVRIVKAFKSQGKIVAMTGDGVNDAPSLKIADIGVGMGISGTDVTKDVADMIIADDNFATIIVAVKEGRKIYSNIQRTIQFLLSTNAVEVFTLFLTSIFLPQYVFLVPSQLLFINFITDSLPAISLGLEPAEKDIMDRPPRDSKQNVISLDIWAKMLYQAGIQIILVMSIYVLGINLYTPQVASTMAFLTINIMQLLHAINLKTRHSIFKVNIFKNKLFNISFLAGMALVVLVGLLPPLQTLFELANLNFVQWLIVIAFSVSIIPIVEFAKFLVRKFGTERIK